MKTFTSIKALLGAGVLAAVAAQPASAAFNNGDLILSFYKTSGFGSTNTVVANLGAGYTFRDATSNQSNVINLGSLLSSTFGSDWYDQGALQFSIIGVRQPGFNPAPPPAGNQGSPVVNGDARNAVYAGSSKTDNNPLTYSQYTGTASALNTTGTQISTYNGTVATALASVNQATIATSTANTIEDFTTSVSPFVTFSQFSPTVFSQSFASGSLFTYNSVAYEGALTLQRLNRTDATTGNLTGNVVVPGVTAGSGSNEGFFAIRNDGQVDYVAPVPEPGTWAAMALFAGGAAFAGWRKRRMANA
ncbi:MAG: PEP-CTERM sorting domain-containing protein [Chthoniobacterales bacterium]